MSRLAVERYHALGNVYLVLEGTDWDAATSRQGIGEQAMARRLCDPHCGLGSDGLLLRTPGTGAGVGLRILNPDGSEAEKSGNGLRIFARYLFDRGIAGTDVFEVDTLGGRVRCRVLDGGAGVQVDLGRVSFRSSEIPMTGPEREVLRETIEVAGVRHEVSVASIGNPHCVLFRDVLSEAETRALGPLIETADCFPKRTNVQFVRVRDRANLEIEIWERGAGRTLASGSSSSGAAAVARRLGLCDSRVSVHMPGGSLDLEIGEDFSVRMTGPVTYVASCRLASDALRGAN